MRRAPYALVVAVVGLAAAARAAPESEATRACLEAHVSVQERRLAGDLVGAATAAGVCAAEACPALPRGECARWAEDIAREMPTVTVTIRGIKPREEVRLVVDGESRPLETGAIGLNPGLHSIEVVAGGRTLRRSVHLVRGQAEPVVFDLGARAVSGPAAGATADGAPPPIGPIVLGATGLAAFVVFGVSAGLGVSEYADLEQTCAPRCSEEETSGVDTKLLVADVALGVGSGLVLAGGVWLIIELAAPSSERARVGARGLSFSF